jgi:hypothetical protein
MSAVEDEDFSPPDWFLAIREVKAMLAAAQDAARREDIFDLLAAIDAAKSAAFRLASVTAGAR